MLVFIVLRIRIRNTGFNEKWNIYLFIMNNSNAIWPHNRYQEKSITDATLKVS